MVVYLIDLGPEGFPILRKRSGGVVKTLGFAQGTPDEIRDRVLKMHPKAVVITSVGTYKIRKASTR